MEVSTYYKEPVGYPTLLDLLFAVTGTSEGVAFFFARVLFSLAVGSVYLLARDNFRQPWTGWLVALAFLATPPVLEYSVSAGTDLGTVLFAVLGLWGLVSGAYPVAVAALALVAQMRLEAVVLTLFLFASPVLGRRWKLIGLALISGPLFHLVWVLSAAPAYASSVGVEAAFSAGYVPANFIGSLGYLLDGGRFPWGISVLAALSLLSWGVRTLRSGSGEDNRPRLGEFHFVAWIGLMTAVYLAFYEGSFGLNPRYSIQMVVPLILLAGTALKLFTTRGRVAVVIGLAFTLLYSNLSPKPPDQDHSVSVDNLAADHRRMARIAGDLGDDSIVIAGEPEVFLNHGVAALHAIFASERPGVDRGASRQVSEGAVLLRRARQCCWKRELARRPLDQIGVFSPANRVLFRGQRSLGPLRGPVGPVRGGRREIGLFRRRAHRAAGKEGRPPTFCPPVAY